MISGFLRFTMGSAGVVLKGGPRYYAWVGLLLIGVLIGLGAYAVQFDQGLIATNMRDQVSWGFYIGNFAFLVGVAAAAVVLVIPAYVYRWGPIREVVLVGELLAVAAIVMCMMFVTVDIGRPELAWHMMPFVGTPNFPYSMLTWDVLVLTAYLCVNLFVVTYLVFKGWQGRKYDEGILLPLVFLSIPTAIAIHTVTAFLFVALPSRPFWHTAILAPRFIASAFCSGPALMLLLFMVLRKLDLFKISDAALLKIGEILAYAMAVNLFLLGAELFAEFYYPTLHTIHAELMWFGTEGHHFAACGPEGCGGGISVYARTSLVANLTAFVLFVVPALRHKLPLLALGCVLAIFGVFVEKGMGLLLPGMTPDALGEIYDYAPSAIEIMVGLGIWAFGALLFTLMTKVSFNVREGHFQDRTSRGA